MQVNRTVFDVAVNGRVIDTVESRPEADAVVAGNPGAQIRTRSESSTVPAVFGVFVNGEQVGDPYTEPGAAAKAAKAAGGMIRMVAAP